MYARVANASPLVVLKDISWVVPALRFLFLSFLLSFRLEIVLLRALTAFFPSSRETQAVYIPSVILCYDFSLQLSNTCPSESFYRVDRVAHSNM